MCTFITAYVPVDALGAAARILEERKHGVRPIHNSNVQRALPCAAAHIVTSGKYCDCGTQLASGGIRSTPAAPSEREIRKLRAKRWSEARIRRWQDERAVVAERVVAEERRRREAGSGEADGWVETIRAVLDSKAAPWFGLLVHSYSGRLETERVHVTVATIDASELTPGTLVDMEEDSLLLVRRTR